MMGFVEIENIGKQALEQFPMIKRSIKRVYQFTSVVTSGEKNKFEGNIIRISPDDEFEYFYGYYDKSPWDAMDRYMICIKVKQAYKSVAPKEPGVVGVIDTQEGNKFIEIGITHSWNVQQSCMAQWMGPDFKTKIIYNDFRDGKYCSVIYNWAEKHEETVLPLPVYDVARDGSFALSLDFSRLHRMRPGYGYSNLPETTKGELCPDKPCIWKMDIPSGKVTELFKYTEMAAFEPDESMQGAEHKVNHLMISPNGKRFMVLHRWFQKGRKHTRLVTVNIDKSEIYNLSDDVFVSHCYWKNDHEILSFLRKKETGNHYYLMKDQTQEYKMYWPRLATDGHCSYSPDGELVVTDSYPNRKRMAFIYLCREEQSQPVRIGKVFSPFKYDNDCRCDLHPRWNHAGDKICIDSVHEGRRGLYVIPIAKKDIPVIPGSSPQYIKGKYKIAYIITSCKNSGPMNQTLNIIKNLDREVFEPIVITLFEEDLGNSVVQRYLDVVPEFHCLKMSKLASLVDGKKKLATLLDEIKPDIIQGLGMPPYTMSLGYHDAVHLVTLRNYCYQDYPDKYGKKLGAILAYKDMNLISRQNAKGETFVTCSNSLSTIYKEKHGMEFSFIRNGVDISQYTKRVIDEVPKLRSQLKLPKDKVIFVYSGNFIDRKNQREAINAFLSMSNKNRAVLLLLGDGNDYNSLYNLHKDDENIIFTGKVANVNEYLRASDIYISTSKSEGMPNGVLEAMASGLPLILSNILQHLEVLEVDKQCGYSYDLGNIHELANIMDKMLDEDLLDMGERSYRAVINNFTASGMSKRYQKLYLNLIEHNGSKNEKR